ncbi:hypothetical protein [Sphingomonas sanxanigenens]|uniref:Uncharacterized protein n=1 Tax=Sphingomonas sanxanigenens DSM 19645 = NX02 TaxID=1123269 RepID=W0AJX6_9SPHN|nr:hypothetical protein [Sphingomonas sanxanigenens]AHE57441.1 hypothetical protein NX02_29385 [Sphingomonas sanxanigenens DSM 19645 = NX02]
MNQIKRGIVGGLRGPGLTDADQVNLDAKVDEAAGYAQEAGEQLGLVNTARADALTQIDTSRDMAVTDLNAIIAGANTELDTKVNSASSSVALAAAQAEAARQAAAEIKPAGGSIRFPYDNNSQFPLQESRPNLSNTGVRGLLTQSFGSRTTPILRYGVDCCHYRALEKDDRVYPAVEMLLEGATTLTQGTGQGWSLVYFTAGYGSSDATRRQARRFRFYANAGAGGGGSITVWSRLVPMSWRRIGVAVHRASGVFRIDVHNLDTDEILTGTGTDNAAFAAELSATNNALLISAMGPSGSVPSKFAIGGTIFNDVTSATLSQPLTQSFSMMAHGLSFYAEEAVTNADLLAIHRGAHPTTVITPSTIKWLRRFTSDPTSFVRDPLCVGDTSAPCEGVGRWAAGSDLFRKGTGTATVAPAPRNRYVYGLRPGQQAFRIKLAGRCWPTEDSTVSVRFRDASGVVVRDWTAVATVQVAGSWTGYSSKVNGTGGTTGTYALIITGNGTGAAGRFVVNSGGVTAIYVDNPGSGYTSINLDFSNAPGLTGASAVATLAPADTSNWSGALDCPKHSDWLFREVRLVGKSGATSVTYSDCSQFAVGYKWALIGQSQVSNGLSAATLEVQYKGVPANFVRNGANAWTANIPPFPEVEPLGLRIGADQYKSLALELNRWVDAPFEVVVAAQGGTGPADLMENQYILQNASGMWDQMVDLIELGGKEDYSGVLMGWHTDLTDEGGRFGQTMLEGFWLGRGPYAYGPADHFFGRATFAGTTMTVASARRGTLTVGTTIRIMYDVVGSKQTAIDTKITALGTGAGGVGTYTLSAAVPGGDPATEVGIIGLHEQAGTDAIVMGYITAGNTDYLHITSIVSGTPGLGDRPLVTGGSTQTDGTTFLKQVNTSGIPAGVIASYIVSDASVAIGSSATPVQFRLVKGTARPILSIMDAFGKGTPIFYMPPTRHNIPTVVSTAFDYDATSTMPYIEGVRQGGVGAARDSGTLWAKSRGYPVGVHSLDYTQPDAYHPDNTATGKVRVGRHFALSLAKGQGLAQIGQPAVIGTSGRFTDGTRTRFRFQIDCPNFGRLRSGDGLGNVTPCVELSRDNGATWSRSKHTAAVNPTTGGTLPGDMVEVTISDALYRVAGLRFRVLAGGPFAWGVDNSPNTVSTPEAEANDAAINKMLYEEIDVITDLPGLCVAPSQSVYTVADA